MTGIGPFTAGLATTFPFAPLQTASLGGSPSTLNPGGTVSANWSGIVSPTGKDWIGVFTPGAPASSALSYQ